MQTRIATHHLPFAAVAMVVALAAALILGIAFGYALKPAVGIGIPAQNPVVTSSGAAIPADEANPPCVFVNRHKQC